MFDTIVIVDWSASARPKRGADSIWICRLDVASGARELHNPPTRTEAQRVLVDLFSEPGARSGTTLAGFDFPFGYPSGFAQAAGLRGATPWLATWAHLAAHLHDDDQNGNDRWQVAADLNRRLVHARFWGAPHQRHIDGLPHLKARPADALSEFRTVERRLREQHRLRPFSCWQLMGAGSVGSQALTGIPVLQRLRTHVELSHRLRVWPFEPVDLPSAGRIVAAEVWPSMLAASTIDAVDEPVKDARQVTALAEHLAQRERDGLLVADLHPEIDPADVDRVHREEGWVLLV
ncbi:MAG: cobalamin biosynthesis protein CbiG [Actinomycetota bacterium]